MLSPFFSALSTGQVSVCFPAKLRDVRYVPAFTENRLSREATEHLNIGQFCPILQNEPEGPNLYFFFKGEQMAKEMPGPGPASACVVQPIKRALASEGFSKAYRLRLKSLFSLSGTMSHG